MPVPMTPGQRAVAQAAIEAALKRGYSPSESHAFGRCLALNTPTK